MAGDEQDRANAISADGEMAKAFQALAQGEQTATQLENHLTKLEARIDELMKQANENQTLAESAASEEKSKTAADDTTP
ncbi:hypothetical protein KVT40_008713 [Elsinoe batatas]|uniref:Uncharacterized protein n=1 Tax=Elsinoe batatas TaxID=2601811 RepID=A0A8K0KV07_9PEZI|nr:hypothetical protein KVT40_008713 [Elsinoe batatas]